MLVDNNFKSPLNQEKAMVIQKLSELDSIYGKVYDTKAFALDTDPLDDGDDYGIVFDVNKKGFGL